MKKYDFGGWATKNDLLCADGRTIRRDAFKAQDGTKVPLVWNHMDGGPENILGHAILHNRPDGVYALATFNDSPKAEDTKRLIAHGDITQLSIRGKVLRKQGNDVLHGKILEVSTVLAGANPGAEIDDVQFTHSGDYIDDEVIITTGISLDADLQHEETATVADEKNDETLKDIFDSLSDKQKDAVYAIIGEAISHSESPAEEEEADEDQEETPDEDNLEHSTDPEGTAMTRNIFENNGPVVETANSEFTHAEFKAALTAAMNGNGRLSDELIQHADQYGITDIELLFPDAKAITNTPEFIKRRTEWVSEVISGTNHTPFSRIKSLSADITHEEARARGYIKGEMKKEEFFGIAKRETGPKTIYKKQRLDRDDILDATTVDVVAWLKAEMRLMLEEEVARAILVGDGREIDDPDKINEDRIRPIASDEDFYTHKVTVPANISGESLVDETIRALNFYEGTGTPTAFMHRSVLTDMLLLKDRMGRRLYETKTALADALGVAKIVTVDVMQDHPDVLMIIVNLKDYTVGADKGGQTTFFEDFDIDFNQNKYLYETRFSGALTRHKTALVLRRSEGTQVTPLDPTFADNTITIPTVTGVEYTIDSQTVTGTVEIEETTTVVAIPDEGYYFKTGTQSSWVFNFDSAA